MQNFKAKQQVKTQSYKIASYCIKIRQTKQLTIKASLFRSIKINSAELAQPTVLEV